MYHYEGNGTSGELLQRTLRQEAFPKRHVNPAL